jgi:hypothetical protein
MAKKAGVAEVAVRRYWREAEARVMVEAWRHSGESLAGFARRHGVDRRRVARWASRVEEREPAPVHFHPMRLADHGGGGGSAIEIHLVGGHRVRVTPGFQADDLRRVVAVLEAGTPC